MASAASRQDGGLLVVDAERGGAPRMALGGVGGGAQVPLRHQVRVDVVVGDRAVLVGAGDAVDPEAPVGVVVAERAPQPRRLDEQLERRPRARTASSSVAAR